MPPKRKLEEDRFWSKVKKTDTCWLWTGVVTDKGYGKFLSYRPKRAAVRVHRWAYENLIGPIPEGMLVCHDCDTPACCNPEHLFLGTAKQNSHDCAKKGRHKGRAKSSLTEDQVKKIRKLPKYNQAAIGKKYGVTQSCISSIQTRRSWSWLK